MSVYKKIFPYVMAVAPLAMQSCIETSVETGVVLKVDEYKGYYCDKDGDKLADYRFCLGGSMGRSCVHDYIQVGDTVTFKHYDGDIVGRNLSISAFDIQSVNNRSYNELEKIYNVNKIRSKAGQPKMR